MPAAKIFHKGGEGMWGGEHMPWHKGRRVVVGEEEALQKGGMLLKKPDSVLPVFLALCPSLLKGKKN